MSANYLKVYGAYYLYVPWHKKFKVQKGHMESINKFHHGSCLRERERERERQTETER